MARAPRPLPSPIRPSLLEIAHRAFRRAQRPCTGRLALLVFTCVALGVSWSGAARAGAGRDALQVAERLRWRLDVLGSTAGIAQVTIGRPTRWHGRRVVPVVAKLKSVGFFEHVFPVDDRMVSLVSDSAAGRPLRTEFELHRKHHDRHYAWTADWKRRRLVGTRIDRKNGRRQQRPLDVRVPADTHDGLSWILRVRHVDWRHERRFTFHVHSGNYLYTVRVEKKGTEDAWSPLGLFRAHKLHFVVTRKGGKPFHKEAFVWLTADARRLPVRIQVDVKIGHVDAVLVDAAGALPRVQTAAAR